MDAFDRLPPHSLEAETCVLGSLVIAGNDRASFACVAAMLDKGAFYLTENGILFETIAALHRQCRPVDAVTLREALVARSLLDEIGGTDYLVRIMNTVPSAAHAVHYAGIVREKAIRRRMIAAATEAIASAYAPSEGDDAAALALSASAKLARIGAAGTADAVHRFEDVIHQTIDAKEKGGDPRIKTGLHALDVVTGGIRIGGTTIIAGKPGMGKSVLAKQIARNIAGRRIPVGIITIEESRQKIAENALSNESGICNNRIAFNNLSREEWPEVLSAAARIAGLPIFIVDSARRLSSIVAAAHVLATQHQCKAIIVDHLHLVDGEPDARATREREVAKVSAELKFLWKSLSVAGLECAQLNRAGGSERPTLAHLRDSGSLEQDGDVIILLHSEDYYRRNEYGYQFNHVLEAIVAKNKDGAPASVSLHFDAARQRIEDNAF